VYYCNGAPRYEQFLQDLEMTHNVPSEMLNPTVPWLVFLHL